MILLLLATALAVTIPVYNNTICEGPPMFSVEYTEDACYNTYDCDGAACTNPSACDGLGVVAAYQCLGCTPNGFSARLNRTRYVQYSQQSCGGIGIAVNNIGTCNIDPVTEGCGARRADISAFTNPPSMTTTSTSGNPNETTSSPTGPGGGASSSAAVLETLF